MTHCPTHNRPLATTNRGTLICFPCYFARMRKQRNERISMTDKPAATMEKQKAYLKKYYQDSKVKA
jgi:hypothetical protein